MQLFMLRELVNMGYRRQSAVNLEATIMCGLQNIVSDNCQEQNLHEPQHQKKPFCFESGLRLAPQYKA